MSSSLLETIMDLQCKMQEHYQALSITDKENVLDDLEGWLTYEREEIQSAKCLDRLNWQLHKAGFDQITAVYCVEHSIQIFDYLVEITQEHELEINAKSCSNAPNVPKLLTEQQGLSAETADATGMTIKYHYYGERRNLEDNGRLKITFDTGEVLNINLKLAPRLVNVEGSTIVGPYILTESEYQYILTESEYQSLQSNLLLETKEQVQAFLKIFDKSDDALC